jgi:hypothetical protein
VETIQDFVDRTRGPLVPYVASWYPWVYAHHYLRTEMTTLPSGLKVGPRLSLDEAVELVQVWCGLTGESIDASARSLADAYLQRWGVPDDQIGRPAPQVPVQPAEPDVRNQAPVSPVAGPRPGNGNRPRSRAVKGRGAGNQSNGAQPEPELPESAQVVS